MWVSLGCSAKRFWGKITPSHLRNRQRSCPLKGAGLRATLKPDPEPDKAASKTQLLTFCRRPLTTSFSPRPCLVIRPWTVDPVQQLEETSQVTFTLGDVSLSEDQPLSLKRVHRISLGGGKYKNPGGMEKCRAPPRLPKSQQIRKNVGFGAVGPGSSSSSGPMLFLAEL